MRIEAQGHHLMKDVTSTKPSELKSDKQVSTEEQKLSRQTNELGITKDKLEQAVNSINEIFEINHSELKFIFHEGLEQYFVQLVNSETDEIVREIPPKKLLDTFYEMQKLVGMIVDEKR